VDYADVECILPKNRGTEDRQIQDEVRVYGVATETKVKIPAHAKPHLLEYIDLQMEAFDEERLRSDLDAY
jgi:hypothetical protein